MRVMSEAAIATSVPVPMAIPRSAWARAGASLMPSPTIATVLPCAWSAATLVRLLLRQHLGQDVLGSMPAWRAIASAVARLSPVSIQTSRPSAVSSATASRDSGLSVSATAISPAARPSTRRTSASRRVRANCLGARTQPSREMPGSLHQRAVADRHGPALDLA